MDKRGYKIISNAVGKLEGEIMVEPWPLGMGSLIENPSDFDPRFHLAEDADVRFLEISFDDETRAARVLNVLSEAGLMAGYVDKPSAKTPQLRLLGIVRNEGEKVTHLTLEDLSAQ